MKTVEICPFEYFIILFSQDIQMLGQNDFVDGKCSGCVRTEKFHGSDIVDCVEPFDDHFVAAHSERSFGQIGGDDYGEHFRSESYRYSDSKKQSIDPISFEQSIDQKNKRNHDQHKTDQEDTYIPDTQVNTGFRAFPRDAFPNASKISIEAGIDYYSSGRTTDYIGSHIPEYVQFDRLDLIHFCDRFWHFFYRQRFAGEHRFTDEKIGAGDHTTISRDHSAGGALDHVSTYD